MRSIYRLKAEQIAGFPKWLHEPMLAECHDPEKVRVELGEVLRDRPRRWTLREIDQEIQNLYWVQGTPDPFEDTSWADDLLRAAGIDAVGVAEAQEPRKCCDAPMDLEKAFHDPDEARIVRKVPWRQVPEWVRFWEQRQVIGPQGHQDSLEMHNLGRDNGMYRKIRSLGLDLHHVPVSVDISRRLLEIEARKETFVIRHGKFEPYNPEIWKDIRDRQAKRRRRLRGQQAWARKNRKCSLG